MGDRKRIAIGGDVATTVEVDLWDTLFTVVPVTRSISKKLEPAEAKITEADSSDDLVAAMAAVFDLRLKAVNGGGKPSTHIKKKWNADEVTVDDLVHLNAQIEVATARPL